MAVSSFATALSRASSVRLFWPSSVEITSRCPLTRFSTASTICFVLFKSNRAAARRLLAIARRSS
jgi:hypothetical protein